VPRPEVERGLQRRVCHTNRPAAASVAPAPSVDASSITTDRLQIETVRLYYRLLIRVRRFFQAAIVYSQADRLEYVKMLLDAGSEVNHRDEANHNSMLNLMVKSKKGIRRISGSEGNPPDATVSSVGTLTNHHS